ncbi:hypothetical protein LguiA_015325 [Lonicera macranthoides]
MSLNCLSCQNVQRTDSIKELREGQDGEEKAQFRMWAPRPFEQMRTTSAIMVPKKVNTHHHRIHSSGVVPFDDGQPKLVRSCGMRRDWSFENVRQAVQG